MVTESLTKNLIKHGEIWVAGTQESLNLNDLDGFGDIQVGKSGPEGNRTLDLLVANEAL